MKRIVWLASYPKSGNTWFRAFLANYCGGGDAPASINALPHLANAADRHQFDRTLGYESGELTHDECDALRPAVYRCWSREAQELQFVKTHDAYTVLPGGEPMFPEEATAAALYFVRNPLDICVSLAHHLGTDNIDNVIGLMANPKYCFCGSKTCVMQQLRQRLLTWSAHAASWADAAGQRVKVIRYEDMLRAPEEIFADAVRFAGLREEPARLRRALEFCRFEELRAQEQREGFREKLIRAKSFFRRGEAGGWRAVLSEAQAARIIDDHRDAMRRFGYLDAQDRPVF